MTKENAVCELIRAGEDDAAEKLNAWCNKQGKEGGWDLWFRATFPQLAALIWKQP